MARQTGRLESIELCLGQGLFFLPLFRLSLELIGRWTELEDFVSLPKYLPFVAQSWFPLVAILGGLILIEVSQQRAIRQVADSKLVDPNHRPAKHDVKISHRFWWWTLATMCIAILAAIATSFIWLSTYSPRRPVEDQIHPPLGWDRLTPIVRPMASLVTPPRITQTSNGSNSPNTSIVGSNNEVNIGSIPPAPRRLRGQDLTSAVATLQTQPGKIMVSARIGDAEAYQYAADWYGALKTAGWEMTDNSVRSFEMVGQPWKGVVVTFYWPSAATAGISLPKDQPVGALIAALKGAKLEGLQGKPSPEWTNNYLVLEIGPNPKQQ